MTIRLRQLVPGDLIRIIAEGGWTLAHDPKRGVSLTECPQENTLYCNLEGKLGLILGVKTNRLEQPLSYHLEVEKEKYICKAILADKYLNKI
jgi:hypothetical protein